MGDKVHGGRWNGKGRVKQDCDNLSVLVYGIILQNNAKPLEVPKLKATTRPMFQKDDSVA